MSDINQAATGECLVDRVSEAKAFVKSSSGHIVLEHIDPVSLPRRRAYRFAKRLFDIVSCSVALLLCLVPMAVIAVLVKLDSPGPVFFRQERLGLNGKPFNLVKFRTMRLDAEADGPQWATEDDDRCTRLGLILRKTRLDEIPQFVQVVKGDISLVGPRPERPFFYKEFATYIDGFDQRLLVKPGITGLAQVSGGYDLLPEEKATVDIEYIKHQSLLLDLKIIFMTFKTLISRDGAR